MIYYTEDKKIILENVWPPLTLKVLSTCLKMLNILKMLNNQHFQ